MPYTWHGPCPWGDMRRDDLPEVTELEMRELLAQVTTMLETDFGFANVTSANGTGDAHPHKGPVDTDAELQAMANGESVNDVQKRIIPSLLQKGMDPSDILTFIVDETMARVGVHLGWTRVKELNAVRARIICGWNFVVATHDPADGMPHWLPLRLQPGWLEKVTAHRCPTLGFNASGAYVRSHQGEKEEEDTKPTPTGWSFYDTTTPAPPKWAVKGLLPEAGVGILSGQWGSYKTTVALYMSVAIMTGVDFAGKYRIKRRGAVLYLAAEGSSTLQHRLGNVAEACDAPDKLPFAWRSDCPPLTDSRTAVALTRYVEEAKAHFLATYELPVVVLWVDTWSQAAGLESGEDNDTSATGKVLKTLRTVSDKTGVLVMAIDHFGKMIEAGTRGSSNKEGSSDTVLSTLAEREVNGAVSSTRLAVRKQRDGLAGFEVTFTPQITETGVDEDGDPETSITLEWGRSASASRCPVGQER